MQHHLMHVHVNATCTMFVYRILKDCIVSAHVYFQIKPNAWRKENGEDQWFSEFAEGFRVSLMRAIRSGILMMFVLQYRYTDVRSVILFSVSLGNYHLLNKLYNIWLRFLLLYYDDPSFFASIDIQVLARHVTCSLDWVFR